MTRPLKVYSVDLFPSDLPAKDERERSGMRQRRALVACTSRKRAAALLGTTEHYLVGYGYTDTGSDRSTIALAEPETVFVKLGDVSDFHRMGRYLVRASTGDPPNSHNLRCYGPVIDTTTEGQA